MENESRYRKTEKIESSFEFHNCSCKGGSRREFLKGTAAMGMGLIMSSTLNKSTFAGVPQNIESNQAPVSIPDVSIFMKSPDAYLVGISTSDIIEIKLVDVLKFHGYCAGGVAFAFREAQEAFKSLYDNKMPIRQNIKVKTAYHCCQAGALAYITGARSDFGAERSVGDLSLIPKERREIVFTDKKTGDKVTLKPLFDPHDTFKPLFRRVINEPEFAPKVQQALREAIHEYTYAPVEKLFIVERG